MHGYHRLNTLLVAFAFGVLSVVALKAGIGLRAERARASRPILAGFAPLVTDTLERDSLGLAGRAGQPAGVLVLRPQDCHAEFVASVIGPLERHATNVRLIAVVVGEIPPGSRVPRFIESMAGTLPFFQLSATDPMIEHLHSMGHRSLPVLVVVDASARVVAVLPADRMSTGLMNAAFELADVS